MAAFKIDVTDLGWIDGSADNPDDLCLHGKVRVQLGEEILEDFGTVSATALYLLKSLTEDNIMNCSDIQFIPCCGHFLIADRELKSVAIIGCDKGTDWSVVHEDGIVRIITESGTEGKIPLEDYRAEVFRFADKVEAYYNSCTPKNISDDEFERNGYAAFWNEWHSRRGK